jgi:hypothetical protein
MFGLLAQRRSRLEPDEGEDREHHPLEDAAPVADGVIRVEGLGVEVAGVRDEQPDRKASEDRDLERTEDHSGGRREPDVAVGEREDEGGHQHEPDPPLPRVVPAGLGLEDVGHRPAELQVEERRHERLEADEEPRDQEPGTRAEAASHVRVHAARRWEELRELSDRGRRTDAGDQREADGQRQGLPRVRYGDVDRVRDGCGGRHVRDRLEQNLRQADRVLARWSKRRGSPAVAASIEILLRRFVLRARVCHGSPERGAATMAGPGGVPERPKGTGCKPVGSAYGGSNPPAPTSAKDSNTLVALAKAFHLGSTCRVSSVDQTMHDLRLDHGGRG